MLDTLKRTCVGKNLPDASSIARWDRQTKNGADMRKAQRLLAEAAASIAGKSQERAVGSLFKPGGTYAQRGEFGGQDDVEIITWLVILPEGATTITLWAVLMDTEEGEKLYLFRDRNQGIDPCQGSSPQRERQHRLRAETFRGTRGNP